MPLYRLGADAPEIADADRIWIAPDAHVIGRVSLGLDASVWFGAVLRGDNDPIRIGDRANIQDGAVLHADPGFPLTLGADVTVGHRAIVHGCTIGDGTLVREGAVFPDGSLIVGLPARAVSASPEQLAAMTRLAAEHYVAMGRHFRSALVRID